jgi:hypothetical protein
VVATTPINPLRHRSFRLLSRERDLSEILFAHRTPIRVFALAEPNVAYPRDKRVIVLAALETGTRAIEGADWALPPLLLAWDEDRHRDWEDLVVDIYRIDNAILRTVLANVSEHRDNPVVHEQEFIIRGAC